MQTAVQAIAAPVERMVERIRKYGYQRKHKERLLHAQDELSWLQVVNR